MDNGSGTRPTALNQEYSQLGESWKKHVERTPKYGRAMHGKVGGGRLRIYSLAGVSRWDTRFFENGKLQSVAAIIEAAALGVHMVSDPVDVESEQTGTTVALSRLRTDCPGGSFVDRGRRVSAGYGRAGACSRPCGKHDPISGLPYPRLKLPRQRHCHRSNRHTPWRKAVLRPQ